MTATSVPSLDPFRPWASPRHIAPQEVLASTPKRVLYETYLYTQDRLYPQVCARCRYLCSCVHLSIFIFIFFPRFV